MVLQGAQIRPEESGHEAGRRLLAQMYRQLTGEALPEVLIAPRGTPYFADSSWHFSISHTKRHVFCALSTRPVGIDAEELNRKIRPELAEKILSAGEQRQCAAAEDQRLALLRFWVLKEAMAKFTGEGLRGYPKDTDFSLDDPRVRILEGCLVAVIEEEAYVI